VTQGYRKVAGNNCKGGVNHDFLKIGCPGFNGLTKSNMIILLVLIVIIVIVVLASKTGVSSTLKNGKDNIMGAIGKLPSPFSPLNNSEDGK